MTRWIATAVILTVLAIAGAAVGQEDDPDEVYEYEYYLKPLAKENPNEFHVRYFQDAECTISEEAVESMIDGVLTRSRIKRLTYYDWLVRGYRDRTGGDLGLDQLFLVVEVSCITSNNQIFGIMVRFADKVNRHPNLKFKREMYHLRDYGSIGRHNSGPEFLMGQIKAGVERALTDYLKANFDL